MGAQTRSLFAALVAYVALCAAGMAAAEPRVAILPVVVHSSAADPSYLSEGFSDMLGARLEQLGGMRVVRESDARAATTRLQDALERARGLEADYVVFGSFTQFGDGASLDVQCAPVRSTDAATARTLFVQSGEIGEIIPKLDDLADKIAYFVLGDAKGKAATAARASEASPIRDLIQRLETLERAVYGKGGKAPAAAPAPAPAAAPAAKTAPEKQAEPEEEESDEDPDSQLVHP